MDIKESLTIILDDMESVVKLFGIDLFDMYFIGGAACILGGYTNRATQDFDFIDLQYGSHMGRAFSVLRDYDMLEYESTILAPDFKDRAKKLDRYESFNAYILSPEDIVVSKIIRMDGKDIQDIDTLIKLCDKELIRSIIDSIIGRTDLFESKKQSFLSNLGAFKERYDV